MLFNLIYALRSASYIYKISFLLQVSLAALTSGRVRDVFNEYFGRYAGSRAHQ